MDIHIVGPLAYRGKENCEDMRCTRFGMTVPCYGWHCSYCDQPTSSQGHNCDVAETLLAESKRLRDDTALGLSDS